MLENGVKELCDSIRQIAYDLHLYLGVGYLEKVYETGLAHRLAKAGLNVKTQVPITVRDEDGFVHEAQLLNYLKATDAKHGMLINFSSEKFQCRKLAL